jgi:tRNA(fMet)-specific endonuclease VapC
LAGVVPFESPADRVYGTLRAHALALDLAPVTANLREFSRVPGLWVENWLD